MSVGVLVSEWCYVYRSPVYVWRDGEFRLDHHIDTQQATDVESVDIDSTTWLAVASSESCPQKL